MCSRTIFFLLLFNPIYQFVNLHIRLGTTDLKHACVHACRSLGALTVCVMDCGAMPSLLMVSLKVYLTPASSSEPEIPNTGPLEPRPKFRLEQCSGPCKQKFGGRNWTIIVSDNCRTGILDLMRLNLVIVILI